MKKTKIEWTEATWNPSVGYTKISEGCANCYAETMANRLKGQYKIVLKHITYIPNLKDLGFTT